MKPARKISTGIQGLDAMLRGGLIAGRPYSIVGGPGSGKSILAWQFLLQGRKEGENTLYITLDEPHFEIRTNMESMGLFDEGIKIMDLSPEDISHEGEVSSLSFLDTELPRQMMRLRPTRIVLDSTTSIKALEKDPVSARRRILALMRLLSTREDGTDEPPITSLLLTEIDDEGPPLESYLARGVIRLHNSVVRGARVRALVVEKMRGTDFDENMRPMRIGKGGVYIADKDVMIIQQ